MNLQDREELWVVAGEYVLGVLTAEDAAAIDDLMASNDELRAAVRYWEDRLVGMTELAEPVTPKPELWNRIDRSLAAPEPNHAVVPLRSNLWQNINFWRFTSAIGVAASAILALSTLKPTSQPPAFTAVLQSPADKTAGWIVQGDSTRDLQVIPLVNTTVGSDRSLQLWTKPVQAKKPTSLGLVPPNQRVQIPIERLPKLEAGQLFEITLEPPAGSPLDRPTGKILFVGRAAAVR